MTNSFIQVRNYSRIFIRIYSGFWRNVNVTRWSTCIWNAHAQEGVGRRDLTGIHLLVSCRTVIHSRSHSEFLLLFFLDQPILSLKGMKTGYQETRRGSQHMELLSGAFLILHDFFCGWLFKEWHLFQIAPFFPSPMSLALWYFILKSLKTLQRHLFYSSLTVLFLSK